jgi:hypothetical protein
MQEEEFCLEGLKKTQEEQDPVFKSAILSGFQIAAHITRDGYDIA